MMIIDRETFTELAVHLKLASDAVLATARHLAVLSNGDNGPDEHWAGTLDSLMNMNTEITVMERILLFPEPLPSVLVKRVMWILNTPQDTARYLRALLSAQLPIWRATGGADVA